MVKATPKIRNASPNEIINKPPAGNHCLSPRATNPLPAQFSGDQKRPAERDRAVAGVAVALRESSPQTSPEEEKKERDQRRDQERHDLVLTPVVLPVRERLGRPCLAGRIVPQQGETDEEQGPREHSGQGQEAVESVGWQRSPLSRGAATLLRSPSNP